MKSKGGRATDRSRKGYTGLKSWLQERLAEEGPIGEEADKELLATAEPAMLTRWLPRLFREGSAADRTGVLRKLVPRLGTKAVPFLEEVVVAKGSRLSEKEIALEELKALGRTPSWIPGRRNRWTMTLAQRLLPRKQMIRLVGSNMRKWYGVGEGKGAGLEVRT